MPPPLLIAPEAHQRFSATGHGLQIELNCKRLGGDNTHCKQQPEPNLDDIPPAPWCILRRLVQSIPSKREKVGLVKEKSKTPYTTDLTVLYIVQ
ncbi:MAG: hypothetical protein L7W43_18195 [Rubripirellula sp.]|nr:hypothetical protein [Rubripirellula sp.]